MFVSNKQNDLLRNTSKQTIERSKNNNFRRIEYENYYFVYRNNVDACYGIMYKF